MKRNVKYFSSIKLLFLITMLFAFFVSSNAQVVSLKAGVNPVKQDVPGTAKSIIQSTKGKPGTTSGSGSATAARLQQFYSSTGKYTLSADGIGSTSTSMAIRVNKPNAQSTVQRAILISCVTGGTITNGCVTLAGSPITWNSSATIAASPLLSFTNYWADVTSIVSTQINSFPAGISTLPVTECSSGIIDGEALLVVFNDPTATEKTVIVMVGAQDPNGDNFPVTLAQPIDPTLSGALLDMGLGIGFGFQGNGVQQFSNVSVNGQRLSSAAGGDDDGTANNGALITVGGIGDLNTNPTNPTAPPTTDRSDDELYNILPFITNTTTSLNINTINPSLDDNIFLAYFALSGAAIIGEGILLSQTDATGNVGTQHTVKAAVLNTNGQPVANRAVTFTITSGPNAGNTFTTNTDVNGEAFYTYTGSGGVGTDVIQACFTNSQSQLSCSNTLSFQWLSPTYYSKSAGGLHMLGTWGVNMDGSGANPPDFGAGKTFNLANRPGVYTLTNDWTVGGLIVNPGGSQLQLNNFTLSEAGLSGSGTLTGTLTSTLIVTGTTGGDAGTLNFTPGDGNLFRLTLNRTGTGASATIGSQAVSIYNTLTIANGTLNTNNLLTLKSNAANTARVNPITGVISGNVTVERYIPARRAWRILCAPITSAQTIQSAWQEGAVTTTSNPVPNFGTFMTGGSVANGFDQSPGAVSSMKTYNPASGWVPIANTNATAVNAAAYMTFVYGNRNNVTIPVDQTPGNTTLRSVGPLKVGDQVFPVAATGFTAVPNPFASPINFATITRSGVTNTFYLWDPKIGGINGVGAYVTVSFNGTTYDVSSNAISPESQFIQSGQGFLVFPSVSGTPGSVTIKESDKSNTAETDVFRTAGGNGGNTTPSNAPVFQDPTQGQGLRVSLQTVGSDRTYTTLDEAFASFSSRYSNKLDELDAVKPANVQENLGIATGGEQSLSIERRQVPVEGDELGLKLWNTTAQTYVLQLNPVNLSATGLYAYLKDRYLGTTTPISLKEVSQVKFTITPAAAAARSDRFSIVFSRSDKGLQAPVAVNLGSSSSTTITAYPNPLTGRTLSLQFSNQPAGSYRVAVLNSGGSTVVEQKVMHNGGTAAVPMTLDKKLLPGTYQLQIIGSTTRSSVQILVQ